MSYQPGPVSTALETDLHRHLQRHRLSVWLDRDHHYTALADHLAAADLPYTVLGYRGSFLELLLQLEPLTHGTDPAPLVIHLPGFTEDSVADTPLYPYYKAGSRYRKALDTLITEAAAGRLPPEQIDAFRATDDATLEAADAWLAARLTRTPDSADERFHEHTLVSFVEHLLALDRIAERPTLYHDDSLWQRLTAWTGITPAWRKLTLPPRPPRDDDIAFSVASWALCVEYVDHLQHPPTTPRLRPIPGLPRAVLDACRELARTLRERHPDSYRRIADETEDLLAGEIDQARADALGRVDTFRFQEETLFDATLQALHNAQWAQAARWTSQRLAGEMSFWLRKEPERKNAWQLLHHAATLGQAIQQAGHSLDAHHDWTAALARYTQHGAAVDQSHRHLEQARTALLVPRLPGFERLREILDRLRRHWRDWADAWSRDFNALCRQQGFLPPPELQQRSLFDEVVRPLTRERGITAYFLVDALRYEMAEELRRQLDDPAATRIQLHARFAELPTVTEVGMNALAPVASGGKLRPVLGADGAVKGFHSGEFQVLNPESRTRAISDRVGGDTCPKFNLADVVDRDSASLKRSVARAKLVVIHSREIDQAGEAGLGMDVFNRALRDLRSAWQRLREAGVRHFVITADHGFLLIDEAGRHPTRHGQKRDPHRRHVYTATPADHPDKVGVALASLGYRDAAGHVLFPDTTTVFDTGRQASGFVHGGNSLQERLIPVLTISHRHQPGASALRHGIRAEVRDPVAGMYCLSGRVEVMDQQGLDFGGSEQIELALRVPDSEAVQVELCQTRGAARLEHSSLKASVGEDFELFFRLSGPGDSRVLVELHHPGSLEVDPCVLDRRFPVTATRAAAADPTPTPEDWLQQLSDDGVRRCLAHLQRHGALSEAEIIQFLGSPRAARRFALHFDDHARLAPFEIRIQVVGNGKRYIREGTAP